jgi:hypothetical protein
MSFTYTYSREQLQGMQAKYRKECLFQYIDQNVSMNIINSAKQGKKEFFWIRQNTNSCMVQHPAPPSFTNEELISALLEKFPGTHIEYQETWLETRPGMKEEKKGILIDWS